MQVTTSHLVQLPETAFNYFDRAWKIDDCDPSDWKEYIILGINWVCTRLKNGIPNDGYWEYELSKPTGVVSRVQVSEDWLVNATQLEQQKQRYQEDLVWQLDQVEDREIYLDEQRNDVYFTQELYM